VIAFQYFVKPNCALMQGN